LGKRQAAWSDCEKALKAGRESCDRQLIATALVGLSTEDAFTERFRQVLDRSEEALSLFSEQSSLLWEADTALSRCLLTLGLAAVHLGEICKAREAIVRVLEIRKELPRTRSERETEAPVLIGIALGEWDAVIDAVE
jgi:hypothetical protein